MVVAPEDEQKGAREEADMHGGSQLTWCWTVWVGDDFIQMCLNSCLHFHAQLL